MRTQYTDAGSPQTLLIACGAIAHELVAVMKANDWGHIDIQCLPALWHNSPQRITPAVREKIERYKSQYQHIFVAYADCGTGGQLDSLLQLHNIRRLPGDHCYSFFTGQKVFEAIAEKELGTFYLTDYLAEHFQSLVMDGLGISAHPELLDTYFKHYKRLMYLRQDPLSERAEQRMDNARAAAAALNLTLEVKDTGLAPITDSLANSLAPVQIEFSSAAKATSFDGRSLNQTDLQ